MGKTYNKFNKCCATCANWAGSRTLQNNTYSYVENIGDRGQCYAKVFTGVTQGPMGCEGSNCSKYVKWPAMN